MRTSAAGSASRYWLNLGEALYEALRERLPPAAQAILVFGKALVEMLEKLGRPSTLVDDDRVVVIAGGTDADDADVALVGRERHAIDEGVDGLAVRPHEDAAFGATSGDKVAAAGHDGARKGHAYLSANGRVWLLGKRRRGVMSPVIVTKVEVRPAQ
jgi:hypothetical protein